MRTWWRRSGVLAVNESNLCLFDLSHSGTISLGGNWRPSGIYAERDPLPHSLSCHCLQSTIVTGWQTVRGPQPDSCLRERGSGGGKQRGALDSCLLSSQSSLFIFLLRIARSTLRFSEEGLFLFNNECMYTSLVFISYGLAFGESLTIQTNSLINCKNFPEGPINNSGWKYGYEMHLTRICYSTARHDALWELLGKL